MLLQIILMLPIFISTSLAEGPGNAIQLDGSPSGRPKEADAVYVKLPPEGKERISSSENVIIEYDRNSIGVLLGVRLYSYKTNKYQDGYSYTENTNLCFKGDGSSQQQPIWKKVSFTIPKTENKDEIVKSYPDFSPWEIITEYDYKNPDEPIFNEYLGAISYVTIKNFGESDDIAITSNVKERNSSNVLIVTYDYKLLCNIKKDEKVKVIVFYPQNMPRPYLSSSLGKIGIGDKNSYSWSVSYAASSDSSYGDIYVLRSASNDLRHFKPVSSTDNNAIIFIPTKIHPSINGNIITERDEIGLFTPSGICVGNGIWEGSNLAINVWGDDSQTAERDGILTGETYRFRVWDSETNNEYEASVTYTSGDSTYLKNAHVFLSTFSGIAYTSINNISTPKVFSLSQNYPNPFNPSTTIRYQIPIDCHMELIIYDILGRKVAILNDGKVSAGVHEAVWNGKNDNGTAVGSGVYFYLFRADKYMKQGKMLLMK